MRRTSLILTVVFAALAIALETWLALYWTALLEPRLRSDAIEHARLLAQSHEGTLVSALTMGEGGVRRANVVDAMDRILLLKEATGDSQFVSAIRLEVDYDVVPAESGSLDLVRGEPGEDTFTVDVALYDPLTFELLGIAWLDMSTAFFDRLASDVRQQLIMQGVIGFAALSGIWALLLVIFGKLERTSEARHRAEQQLRVHEEMFGRLLDDLGTYFVYSRDEQGRLGDVSGSVERVLGVSPEEPA